MEITDIAFHDIIGTMGVMLIVGAYLLIQLDYVSGRSLLYSVINGTGALLIIFSLLYDFNLSAFVIEVFWLGISLFGIVRYCIKRHVDG